MIRVSVSEPGPDRRSYRLRYRDPITGRDVWKSSRTTDYREAERAASRLEEELNSGRFPTKANVTWAAFWTKFDADCLPGQSANSGYVYRAIKAAVDELVAPAKLSAMLDPRVLSGFVRDLRASGRSESTIQTYVSHLGTMLRWAVTMKMLPYAPDMPRIPRAKRGGGMKGRPVTDAEFKRMLDATAGVVGEPSAPLWQYWLEGLWWSGLRLEESLNLWWDDPTKLGVDLSGDFPMLKILEHLEKGRRDRRLPMAPEFAEFLSRTPPADRHGPVFVLRGITDRLGRPPRKAQTRDPDWVGRIASRIGKAANVVVDVAAGGRVKYASAHDLRRSFGTRWASRVMPFVLQELMRHSDIKTTQMYYTHLTADHLASTIHEAFRRAGGEVGNCSVRRSVSDSATPAENSRSDTNEVTETT